MPELELTEWDIELVHRLMGGINKKAGQAVTTKTGKEGRTYNYEKPVFGKVRVYCTDGSKLLCNPDDLTLRGYID